VKQCLEHFWHVIKDPQMSLTGQTPEIRLWEMLGKIGPVTTWPGDTTNVAFGS
jgi:hypothetical protein